METSKKSFIENGQKLWSQIGKEKKGTNKCSKIGINDIIWNTNEIKDINDINEFPEFKIKKDTDNENNSILNDFTQNLNDINNNEIFNDKNNKNINGRINYTLTPTSQELNTPSKINSFNIYNINYYENKNEAQVFLNFCEKINMPLSDYICTKEGKNLYHIF